MSFPKNQVSDNTGHMFFTCTGGTTTIGGSTATISDMSFNMDYDNPVAVEKLKKYKLTVDLTNDNVEEIIFKFKDKEVKLSKEQFDAIKTLLEV